MPLMPTFRLPASLAVIGRGRRAASLLLPLLLTLVVGRRRLSVSALHSFSLGARFIRTSCISRRRDLLMNSRRWTSSASRWRRAEPLTLRSAFLPLRRNLFRPTMRGICFLTQSSCWLATTLLLLRGCTLESRTRCCSCCSGWPPRRIGPRRSLALSATFSAGFAFGRGRKPFMWSRRSRCYAGTSSSGWSISFSRRRRHAPCAFSWLGRCSGA